MPQLGRTLTRKEEEAILDALHRSLLYTTIIQATTMLFYPGYKESIDVQRQLYKELHTKLKREPNTPEINIQLGLIDLVPHKKLYEFLQYIGSNNPEIKVLYQCAVYFATHKKDYKSA